MSATLTGLVGALGWEPGPTHFLLSAILFLFGVMGVLTRRGMRLSVQPVTPGEWKIITGMVKMKSL